VDELTRKLLQLDVKNNAYAVAYAQLFVLAPNLTDKLPSSSQFGVNMTMITNTTATHSQPSYPQSNPRTSYDLSCCICKQSDCWLQTCQIAAEYVRTDQVVRQSDGYYIHTDGTHINAYHPNRLKDAIDERMASQQQLPHQSSTSMAPTAFNSFVEVTQIEEKEYVWRVMVELEEGAKEVKRLVATRMQKKKDVEKEITRGLEEKRTEKKVVRQRNKEEKQTYELAYHCEL